MIKVLFVCSGNICRSPTAEVVFNAMAEKAGLKDHVRAESVGTHGLHVGQLADPRAVKAAQARGYDLSYFRAREINPQELSGYDLIVCMDNSHFEHVMQSCHPNDELKVKLFLHFHPDTEEENVPDPYYGQPADFEKVLDLVETGCRALLEQIKEQRLKP